MNFNNPYILEITLEHVIYIKRRQTDRQETKWAALPAISQLATFTDFRFHP
jgi:hypothetical protein